jgi:hypothetical protein
MLRRGVQLVVRLLTVLRVCLIVWLAVAFAACSPDADRRAQASSTTSTTLGGDVEPNQAVGYAAISGRASGAPVPISAIRTDRTARDVVIAYTDTAQERSVLQTTMEGPPLAPNTVVGVCTLGYTVSVDRSGAVAEVSVRAVVDKSRRTILRRAGRHCLPTGMGSLLRAHLPSPLVGSSVIDKATGETLPLFDGRTLLRPTVLPASVEWNLQWAGEGGWNFGYSDGYHKAPGIGITLLQGYTGTPRLSDGLVPVGSVAVGGHAAEFLATGPIRALRWMHGSSAVLVILQPISPTGPDDALDPVLFAFAAGLR